MKLLKLSISFIFIGLISCKNEPKTTSSPTAPASTENQPSTEVPVRSPYVRAAKIDDAFKMAVEKQKPYPMITDSVWHYYIGVSLNIKEPKQYKGEWLDLLPSGKYLAGKNEMVQDSGLFLYNPNATTLEMRSFQDSSSEWRIKVDPDAMLIIGTEKYANNPWQIKLKRRFAIPNVN